MRLKFQFFLAFLTILMALSGTSFASYSDNFTTGDDWNHKMTKGEKVISLVPPTILFHRYGVPLARRPEEYVSTIDQVLLENPYLDAEDVVNIYASTIYALEPESRDSLEYMEREFRRRKGGYDSFFPRLAIQPFPKQELASVHPVENEISE